MNIITIFIPHHKDPSLLPPLLGSLRDMENPECEVQIVLVDNASNDGSVEVVQSDFPDISIFSLEKNLGFAPALNRAVQSFDSEWVCFLNNDMKVDTHWLTSLIHTATHTGASCVGSVLMDWDGKNIQFANGSINWFGKGYEISEVKSKEPYPTFFSCGGSMMIRRDVFLDAGGFDDDFFMIYEDIDLGWRLWLLGHEVFISPASIVYHKGHASLKQENYSRKAVFLERNSLALLYKNLESSSLSIILPLAVQELHLRAQAYRGANTAFSYSTDGYHTVSSLQDYLTKLDIWRSKRAQIQSRRIISDCQIFDRFFFNSENTWAYCKDHYNRIHTPHIYIAIQELFAATTKYIQKKTVHEFLHEPDTI